MSKKPGSFGSLLSRKEPAKAAQPDRLAKLNWGFVLAGYAVLFGAAYFDNMRGPLLPVIAGELKLAHTATSVFLITGHLTAAACTYFIIAAINRWSEKPVTIATILTAIACGGLAYIVTSFATLLLFAAMVGTAVSSMGAMCNVLVIEGTPRHLQGRLLAGLHTMYGLGSIFAASMVSETLYRQVNWRLLFVAPIPLLALFIVYLSFALTRKQHAPAFQKQSATLSGIQILIIALFSAYVAAEVMTSTWLATFLVERDAMPTATAAAYVSGFFACMTVSRLLCFLFITPTREKLIIWASLIVPALAFVLGLTGKPWAFCLVGLVGPFFPLLLGRVSRIFPEKWRSIALWIVVAMQLVLAIFHASIGRLADLINIRNAYCLALLLLVVTIGLLTIYFRSETNNKLELDL